MSTLTQTAVRFFDADWFNAPVRFFERLADARRAADLYDQYSRLSDAELAAQGLSRADVARVVGREALGLR